MGASQGTIVGREPELALITRFVTELLGHPRDLLLYGEAGIGKTTLWRAGVRAATDAGHRVLVSRPAENEALLAYSAIGDLLGDVLDDALADAPLPQRRAVEIALMRRRPGRLQPDARAIAMGVGAALRTLSTLAPVVLAVDDLQWLDASSARALAFALRRLDGEPVALLAAWRDEAGAMNPIDLLTALRDREVLRVDVGPLAVDDIRRLLRDRLHREPPPPAVTRIFEAARGNPFYSLEIARTFRDDEPAGRPLPIPSDMRDVLRARIGRLSPAAREVALTVSAMTRPTVEALRAAASAQSEVEDGLTEVEHTGLVVVDQNRIEFAHPLLGAAVYWSASHAERQAVHRRLATVVPDLEERARHTALAGPGPDPESAALVEAAAEHARLRGAPLAAAELLELSVELTAVDDDQRCHRARLAALNLFDAGDVAGARSKLETLIAATSSRRQRAMTTMELAVRSYNDVDRVQALLRDALPDLDGEFVTIAHANLAWVAITKLDPSSATDHARTAIELADGTDPTGLRVALVALGHAEALGGLDPEPTMRRAAAIGADIAPGEAGHPSGIRAQHLLWAGRIDEALRLSMECDQAYAAAGLELMRHDSLPVLTEVECAAGAWSAASVHADEGYDIVMQAGLHEMLDQMLYPRAHVAALTGDLERARREATDGVARAAAQGDLWAEVANRSVLGFVALSDDDPSGAVEVLSPAERHMAGGTILEPGALPFIPDLVEALVAIGQLDRARGLADRLWDLGTRLDRALAMATASRCRALIASASGDPTEALREVERALAEHDRMSMPFERARTLLVQGETLRRMKRKRPARDALESARDELNQLGSPRWVARAERGLARIGGRAASPTELTATERRVADVVALGLTNKETAARLYLSVHTVESNLSRIYRKLGVRSRSELARRLPPSRDPPTA